MNIIETLKTRYFAIPLWKRIVWTPFAAIVAISMVQSTIEFNSPSEKAARAAQHAKVVADQQARDAQRALERTPEYKAQQEAARLQARITDMKNNPEKYAVPACKRALTSMLKDPESAIWGSVTYGTASFVNNADGVKKGDPMVELIVNSKNGFGGYAGNSRFLCLLDETGLVPRKMIKG